MPRKQSQKRNRWRLAALGMGAIISGMAGWLLVARPLDPQPEKIIQPATLHPVYGSIQELVASPDATLVAEAVVADGGRAISRRTHDDSAVPPEVRTEYALKVEQIMKGDAGHRRVTISLLGGKTRDVWSVREGVPELKRGDRIVLVAFLGNDGKYYPLSGGTAIALQQSDASFWFPETVIQGGQRVSIEMLQDALRR